MRLRFLQFFLTYNLLLSDGEALSAKSLPVRLDNLSPAISPLKYDFDATCEARAFVRSGFQTETAAKEPFERWMRMPFTYARKMKDLTKVPFSRADLPRKLRSQRHPQFRVLARRIHLSDSQIFL